MSQQKMDIPGMNPMGDTLDFMKNMWSGVKMPGMTMPSLSVDDIRKQIADLKTVESWLTLNMNMLRTTIQTLEVQCATYSTLQEMGKSMGETLGSMAQASQGMAGAAAAGSAGSHAAPVEDPRFSFAMPTAEKPPSPESEPEPEAAPEAAPQPTWPPGFGLHHAHESSSGTAGHPAGGNGTSGGHGTSGNGSGAGHSTRENAGGAKHTAPPAAATEEFAQAAATPFVNPAAWWTLLQDQFKQAVDTALKAEPASSPARAAKAMAARSGQKDAAGSARSRSPARKTASAAGSRRAKSAASTSSSAKSAAKKSASKKPAKSAGRKSG